MSINKYRFSIDEPTPKTPEPKNFGALLTSVANAKKPWYTKPWAWGGGTALIAVVAISAWFYFQNKPSNLKEPEYSFIEPKPIKQAREITAKPTEIQKKNVAVAPKIAVNKSVAKPAIVRQQKPWVRPYVPPPVKITKPKVLDTVASIVKPADQPVVKPVVTPTGRHYVWFRLPYDTFTIAQVEKNGSLQVSAKNQIQYPAGAWVAQNGDTVKGAIKILYREAIQQAAAIFSRVPFVARQDGNTAPLENNGAFEILAMQGDSFLKITPGKNIVANFSVSDIGNQYSGFQYLYESKVWDKMDEGYSKEDTIGNAQKQAHDVYLLKRQKTFWGRVKALFHKPQYEKVGGDDHVKKGSKKKAKKEQVATVAYPDSIRSFEIHKMGWFASGMPLPENNRTSMNVGYSIATKDTLQPGIYQVFLNKNVVVHYETAGHAVVSVAPEDHCIFIAFLENRNGIAILHANQFETQVKIVALRPRQGMLRSDDKDVQLEIIATPIRNVQDLQKIIDAEKTRLLQVSSGTTKPETVAGLSP